MVPSQAWSCCAALRCAALRCAALRCAALRCATYPWLTVYAKRGNERSRATKIHKLTSPVTTASAVGIVRILALI